MFALLPLWTSSAWANDPYQWLEVDSPTRTRWILDQNQRALDHIKSTQLLRPVGELVRKALNKESVTSVSLRNGDRLSLINPGIGGANELALFKKNTQAKEVLLSSFMFSRKGIFNFVTMSLSPNQRYVGVMAADRGTINEFPILIFDLWERRLIERELRGGASPQLEWLSDTRFVVDASTAHPQDHGQLGQFVASIYEVSDQGAIQIEKKDGRIGASRFGMIALLNEDITQSRLIAHGRPDLVLADMSVSDVLEVSGQLVLLSIKNSRGQSSIVQVEWGPEASPTQLKTIYSESPWAISSVSKRGTELFIFRYWGKDQQVVIHDLTTKTDQVIFQVPPSSSALEVRWKTPGEKLEVELRSPVLRSKKFLYDPRTKTFAEGDPEVEMMKADGKEYVTEYLQVRSADGVFFPVRVVTQKGAPRNGTGAAYIYVYGGFKINGRLHPYFNPMEYEFLKRGGALVLPAIRGGLEFGLDWNEQGIHAKKQNTINDVHATAQAIRDLGYAPSEKIILQGWSNGGFVVASAGLQRPDLYGLVLPGNGVLDFLAHERFDPRCATLCLREYGDPKNPVHQQFMLPLSPIELAKRLARETRLPRIVVLTGRNDTRVDPAHSYRFTQAVLDHTGDPSRILQLAINHAGHWMIVEPYGDLIGWRSQTMIWSIIFKHSGFSDFKEALPSP